MSIRRTVFSMNLTRAFLLGALLPLAACGGDDDDPSGPDGGELVADWFEGVSADGALSVSIQDEAAPAAGAGPAIDAQLTGAFITGGTTQLDISGEAFDGLVIALDGVDGHVDVEYGGAQFDAEVALTLYGDLPDGQFSLLVAAVDGDEVGEYVEIPVNIIEVGTGGPIQVSVSWNTASDVDLHVIDPDGEEIYYASSFSDATGGELDLDSNAACSIDDVNNENITWTDEDSPVHGEYIVRVDYWDSCGVETPTVYIVTVRVEGEPTRTIGGTLTGEGTHGGEGAGELVTTFEY